MHEYYDYAIQRRERREDLEAEAYAMLFEIEDSRRRKEWAREFGRIPYEANGADIHRVVTKRMADMREEA